MIKIIQSPARGPNTYELWIYDEKKPIRAKIEWVPIEEYTLEYPTMILNNVDGALQSLANDLYMLGFAPSESLVKDSVLNAKENHLKDLKEILNTVLPHSLRKEEKE